MLFDQMVSDNRIASTARDLLQDTIARAETPPMFKEAIPALRVITLRLRKSGDRASLFVPGNFL
jgi:hypothetical protein